MARTFNGTSDKITTGLGAAGGLTGATTIAVIIKSNSDTQATGVVHLGAGVSGSARIGIGLSATKQYWRIAGSTPSATAIGQTIADGWGLQAWCRAAGAAQVVRQHSYIYGTNTWAHTDHATTSGNAAAPITSCTIGAEVTASFWNGDIAAIVVFDRKLTDQEIESLAWSVTTWHTLAPKILWTLDQDTITQLVNDLTGGGAGQSAISGTTASASSVPVFNYSDGVWIPTIVKVGASTYNKDGSILASILVSGPDQFNPTEAGSIMASGVTSGADSFNPVEAGSLLAGSLLSGADVFSPTEAGSLLASLLTSGADVSAFTESGTVSPKGLVSGADARDAIETGALLAAALLSGPDSFNPSETGSLALSGLLSGPDAATHAETASLLTQAIISGVGSKTKDKAGSVLAGTIGSGPKVIAYTETGSLLAKTFGSGADAYTAVKSGAILAGGQLYGADVHVAVETGTLLAVSNISAFRAKEHSASGSVMVRAILAGIKDILSGYVMLGNEVHLLTSATVEKGRLTAAGPEEAVLVVLIPERAKLTRVDS